jgi:hypothetical protein
MLNASFTIFYNYMFYFKTQPTAEPEKATTYTGETLYAESQITTKTRGMVTFIQLGF